MGGLGALTPLELRRIVLVAALSATTLLVVAVELYAHISMHAMI
ncbi:MAG: hypothetical protein M5U01_07080 [Ardenticatenaceae bacterium]|nr:hypothetical protein [Ardenticatenaceae bacterium]